MSKKASTLAFDLVHPGFAGRQTAFRQTERGKLVALSVSSATTGLRKGNVFCRLYVSTGPPSEVSPQVELAADYLYLGNFPSWTGMHPLVQTSHIVLDAWVSEPMTLRVTGTIEEDD